MFPEDMNGSGEGRTGGGILWNTLALREAGSLVAGTKIKKIRL